MTLALLIMAVGGAWAQSSLDVVKLEAPAGWNGEHSYMTVADLTGFKAVTLDEAKAWTGAPTGTAVLFYAFDGENAYYVVFENGEFYNDSYAPFEKDEIYINSNSMKFYYTAKDPNAIDVTWNATAKTGTFTMPASDVLLQVEYEPTKVTMDANDKTMGTVEVSGEIKVEWTAETWQGWTVNDKVHTVDDITMTSSQSASVQQYTANCLDFFVDEWEDNSTVTFSTTGDPFTSIEFAMTNDYDPGEGNYHGIPNIQPADGWTFSGKSAVWEGEATKSLTLKSCSTTVSKITFFQGGVPDGVTVNGDGTFTVAKTATVTLKATPAEGYKFLYWEDDQTNTNPVREVTIESGLADKTYKAVFEEILYNVTFVEGTNLDEWKAEPNAAAKNTEIKVTYSGAKKVLGVKVEKKAPAEGHALSASAVGEIVGSDGKAYAVADKDNLPEGVTAVAMVASKSGSNGLAIQLNSSPVEKTWADAKTYAEGLTAVPGGTWRLPSMADWQTMFVSCAVTGDAGVSDFMDPIAGFNAKIAATGIEWLSYNYWSSTGTGDRAWYVFVSLGGSPYAAFYESETSDEYKYLVLGCLFF